MLGGDGIIFDNYAMKAYADMEALYTYEGTYDINSLVAARELTGIAAFKVPKKNWRVNWFWNGFLSDPSSTLYILGTPFAYDATFIYRFYDCFSCIRTLIWQDIPYCI